MSTGINDDGSKMKLINDIPIIDDNGDYARLHANDRNEIVAIPLPLVDIDGAWVDSSGLDMSLPVYKIGRPMVNSDGDYVQMATNSKDRRDEDHEKM